MRKQTNNKNWVLILWVGTLFACGNSKKDFDTISQQGTSGEQMDSVYMQMFDEDDIKVTLKAKTMLIQGEDRNTYVFPEGLKVVYFDSMMTDLAQVTANYGVLQGQNDIRLEGDVVVKNLQENQTFYTEILNYGKHPDTNAVLWYTFEPIRLNDGYDIHEGNRFWAEKDFVAHKIWKYKSEVEVDDVSLQP